MNSRTAAAGLALVAGAIAALGGVLLLYGISPAYVSAREPTIDRFINHIYYFGFAFRLSRNKRLHSRCLCASVVPALKRAWPGATPDDSEAIPGHAAQTPDLSRSVPFSVPASLRSHLVPARGEKFTVG